MSSRMKAWLLVLGLPACFDVEQREQSMERELLLGDFEEENYVAPFPFEKWEKFFFNPAGDVAYPNGTNRNDTQSFRFAPSRADAGDALMVNVDMGPRPNADDTGGGFTVKADPTTTADLNQYRAIEFYAKMETVGPPLGDPKPYVQLGCVAAPAINPTSKPELLTAYRMPQLSNEWRKFDLPLSEFDDPNYDGQQIAGDAVTRGRECRAVVDEIRFVISARVNAGDETTVVLYVDDVRLY